jgi:uncharacterized surface protein with fasciclin (FAS1) repeats
MKRKHLVSIVLALMVVLLPSSFAFAQEGDVVDTAAANEDFSTLVAAVQAAGLVDALKGEGPFTVFAPVNAAFEPLAADGTLDTLLADPSGDLTKILLYHVVPGKVMSSDLSDGLQADTLEGSPVTFTISDSGAMVNDANIVAADIEVSNGVIHVIDKVLVPPAEGDMAAGEMAEGSSDSDMAPTTMPVTGVGGGALPMPMVVAAGLLAAVAVAAVIGRRRNA